MAIALVEQDGVHKMRQYPYDWSLQPGESASIHRPRSRKPAPLSTTQPMCRCFRNR
jgi:hypothetical protein